jgi:hypothetical protein
MYVVSLGNLIDVVLPILQRTSTSHDLVHASSTPPLTSRASAHFDQPSSSGECDDSAKRMDGMHSRKTGPRELQIDRIARLDVRWVSACSVSRILSRSQNDRMTSRLNSQAARPTMVDDGSSLLLSRDELTLLTGTRQPLRQRRWLEERAWPYADAVGRSAYPRVARVVFDEKMRGRDPSIAAPQPRFEALDGLGRSM